MLCVWSAFLQCLPLIREVAESRRDINNISPKLINRLAPLPKGAFFICIQKDNTYNIIHTQKFFTPYIYNVYTRSRNSRKICKCDGKLRTSRRKMNQSMRCSLRPAPRMCKTILHPTPDCDTQSWMTSDYAIYSRLSS